MLWGVVVSDQDGICGYVVGQSGDGEGSWWVAGAGTAQPHRGAVGMVGTAQPHLGAVGMVGTVQPHLSAVGMVV
jgi:hypothetical protein